MLDAVMRPLIDPVLNRQGRRLARAGISADAVTLAGLALGLAAAALIALGHPGWALLPLLLGRLADGLDGAVARATHTSDFGGYLDIVSDFLVYGAVPMAFVWMDPAVNGAAGAFLLTSFYLNGASFLGFAILAEKRGDGQQCTRRQIALLHRRAAGGDRNHRLLRAAVPCCPACSRRWPGALARCVSSPQCRVCCWPERCFRRPARPIPKGSDLETCPDSHCHGGDDRERRRRRHRPVRLARRAGGRRRADRLLARLGRIDPTNAFIGWVGDKVQDRHGVTLEHVKLADTADAVSRVLAEKAAGQDGGGAVDLIWINGKNFAAMKQNGLLYGPFAEPCRTGRWSMWTASR